ncbi:NINE protein [Streptomyces sp. ISL-90]|nr:NINE protein [Streptomyces sp. ISL-90]
MSSERRPSAGWYDDVTDAAVLRYWDGNAWTPHTAPKPADAAPAPLGEVSGVPFEPETTRHEAFAPESIDEATVARPSRASVATSVLEPGNAPVPESTLPEVTAALFGAIRPAPSPFDDARPAASASFTHLPAPPVVTAHDGRSPDEHTTVPLPPEGGAASGPYFSYDAYRSAGRTFIATWLFALLLGYWGADRFYLGKIGTAILKLVTLGGLGVWVFVDLLLVLFGAQRDRDGRPLEGFEEHKRIAWIVTGGLVALGVVSAAVSGIVAAVVR